MIVKKFQGKTEEEALTKARDELGKEAIVMNVKTIRPRGLMSIFKQATVEITAALEEGDAIRPKAQPPSGFDAVADEQINVRELKPLPKKMYNETNAIEEKLENLQSLLEKKLTDKEKPKETEEVRKQEEEQQFTTQEVKKQEEKKNHMQFVKAIYGIMLENEVDEKIANQIMEEVGKIMQADASLNYILSNIYQKMILKLGQPKVIELTEGKPKIVFFVGPTGVGKTTTIAKLASIFKVEKKKEVALLTADTYRIAATEQLKTYANILKAPLTIIYSPEDMEEAVKHLQDYDLVLVDTAGHSHKNEEQKETIKSLIDAVGEEAEKEVYLVLSATTKYKDLKEIIDSYGYISDYRIIFTKLDETTTLGNLLNVKIYSGADLSYTTNGQDVPDDVEVFHLQKVVKQLLGGKKANGSGRAAQKLDKNE